MAVAPTTAYFMVGERCRMNCAFCAQARHSQSGALRLSRVTWPEYDLDAVLARLAAAASWGNIRRACLQVTVTGESCGQAISILRAVRRVSDVPVDVAILPDDLEQVGQLLGAGAEHIGFGLDAACERVFRAVKRDDDSGTAWIRSLSLIEDTARAYPARAAVHLIVGLGETEQELVERVQWARDLGVTVGLFAFTPVRGTRLAGLAPPPLPVYRRLQAACWLIVNDAVRCERMVFDAQGRLIDLGAVLPSIGEPFQTSGCPDCNRPYYNERPRGPIYNYPRPLSPGEARRAAIEMEMDA